MNLSLSDPFYCQTFSTRDAVYHNQLSDLLALAELLASLQYLNPRSISPAGRLPIAEFLNCPEHDFLVNFGMMPESFWALVELLETRGRDDHWHQNSGGAGGGDPGRPAFQQIAVGIAFYVLGSAGGIFERIRMKLNIGKGVIQTHLFRTVNLLASLSRICMLASWRLKNSFRSCPAIEKHTWAG